MKRQIEPKYALLILAEILLDEKLINEPTFNAIKMQLQDEQSHISQTSK